MRNTILRKTIFAYVLFALLCFLAVATISYRIDLNRIIQLSSEEMYLQAVNIAASYGNQYYTSNETLTQITNELSAIAALSETRIMLISPQNFIIIDTATPATNDFVSIPDFDPAASGNRLYTTGTFYNTLDEECLTVTVPIVHNLAVRGYVSIHKPVQVIQSQLNTVFNTNYYTMLLCCLLALIFVLLVYHEVHKPLK
jgi:hypothetical protein